MEAEQPQPLLLLTLVIQSVVLVNDCGGAAPMLAIPEPHVATNRDFRHPTLAQDLPLSTMQRRYERIPASCQCTRLPQEKARRGGTV
jgi:hypothetical protein